MTCVKNESNDYRIMRNPCRLIAGYSGPSWPQVWMRLALRTVGCGTYQTHRNKKPLCLHAFTFGPRLEVGLLKFVAAHLVLKEIHFAGIPLPTQCTRVDWRVSEPWTVILYLNLNRKYIDSYSLSYVFLILGLHCLCLLRKRPSKRHAAYILNSSSGFGFFFGLGICLLLWAVRNYFYERVFPGRIYQSFVHSDNDAPAVAEPPKVFTFDRCCTETEEGMQVFGMKFLWKKYSI